MLMKTLHRRAIWQQQKRSHTEEEMKLFARSYFREIRHNQQIVGGSADRCVLRNQKK
jgi:hypothetical protein